MSKRAIGDRTSHAAVVCRAPGELVLEDRPEPERATARCWSGCAASASAARITTSTRAATRILQYPRVIGHELVRRGAVEAPDGSALQAGRDGRRQPLRLLRRLHRLPQRQAQLLRPDRRAGRASRRRHVRADPVPEGNLYPGRQPHARPGGQHRVPGDRRPCGAPRSGLTRAQRALVDRRGADRPRHGALRRPRRGRRDDHGPRRRRARLRAGERHRGRTHRRRQRRAEAGRKGHDGDGFDVVFDATGSRASMESALRPCRPWRHATCWSAWSPRPSPSPTPNSTSGK